MLHKSLLLIPIVAIALTGCNLGTKDTTVLPDGSKVKVDKEKDGMTIEGNGVSGNFGGSVVITEADVHLPFYPGAKLESERSMKVKTEKEESILAHLTTSDEPTKVRDFYKEKMPKIEFSEMSTGEGVTIIGQAKTADGAQQAITITRSKSDSSTLISIGYGKQSK